MSSRPAHRSTSYLGGALRLPQLHTPKRQRRPSSAEHSLTWLVDGLEQDARRGVPPQQLLATASAIGPTFKNAAAGLGSLPYARFLSFIARTSLALGTSHEATTAERILDVALDELERSNDWSRDVVATYVDATLSLAVSLKARGHDNHARQLLRATIHDPVLGRYRSDWDILPLFRQEVMMVGTLRAHIGLGDVARQYRGYGGPEYYGCVKRVFEFVLNHGARRDAKRAFPFFMLAFESTRSRVTPLAELSFLKNAALASTRQRNTASRVSAGV
jgi:hypothetical protein